MITHEIPPGYATTRQLARLFNVTTATVLWRCHSANVPYKRSRYGYLLELNAAKAACSPRDTAIPRGYISLPELAELAEMSKSWTRLRLKQANVPYKRIMRTGTGGGRAGGHAMYVYPQREALNAVLED